MGALLKYSGIVTKIRAKKSRLITDAQYHEIAECHNVSEIASYLKRLPAYEALLKDVNEKDMHRGQLEELISSGTYNDYDSLYAFANINQRKFLKIYSERFEVKLLKKCFTDIFSKGEILASTLMYQGFFDEHTCLNLDLIKGAKSMQSIIDGLQGTIYYIPLVNVKNSGKNELLDYEIALDFLHFSLLWKKKDKIVSKKDSLLLEKEYGAKFDMLNLYWIYRAKQYYNMTKADIYSIIIPTHYKISKKEIIKLVESENMEEFNKLLKVTYYGKKYADLRNDTLETMYGFILHQTLQEDAKKNPYSIATIYSYLYHKEHEISRLVVAIESVRYGVDAKTTMEYVLRA